MKITNIKQQVKNPDRVSIFIDGKYSFSLSLGELVEQKLKLSQELEQKDLKKLKQISDDGKLKARALEWVMTRPRSLREFRDYLRRKKAEPEFVDRLETDFLSRGYLDERRFADWLSDVRRRRGKSDRTIRSELASKGINREIADEVMTGYDEGESEQDRLKKLVDKKQHLPRYKADQQKLMQYLARQGFAYDDIKRALIDDK